MNFCSQCGSAVVQRVPSGDHLPRYVCDHCTTIHYQNPKIVAGCIAEWNEQILLCKRAIEPQYGRWTLPAGFMENGETTQGAATRETWEEAQAKLSDVSLYGLFNLPYINQVYIIFRGKLIDGAAAAGTESLAVNLYREADIPWHEIAFPVVVEVLERYFADRKTGHFVTRISDVVRNPDRSVTVTRY